MSAPRPTRAGIDEAAARIRPFITRTPFVSSAWLSAMTGADVRLKLELTQETGSFKVRGAMNAILTLRQERPAIRRVVTASAGNHGQAIARAAASSGLSARVFVPASAPDAKRQSMRRLGAEMIEASSYDEAEALARRTGLDADAVFISAYSHRDVIAGAGTIALEMIEDEPALDVIVVPIGGGGLASGVAIAARSLPRSVRVIAVEAAASPVFTSALAAGRIVTVDVAPTLADGLAGNMEPDSQTFAIVRELVERVVAVDEALLSRAMRELIEHDHLIVEGAGAAGVAGLLGGGDLDLAGRRVGVVLTGRNVDAPVVAGLLAGR